MDRRDFIATMGGLVVLATFATVGGVASSEQTAGSTDSVYPDSTATAANPDSPAAVGPVLVSGLSYQTKADDATKVAAFYGDTAVFEVDEVGRSLLQLADGNHSLEQIANAVAPNADLGGICDFYLELGQAGYLQNQFLIATTQSFV